MVKLPKFHEDSILTRSGPVTHNKFMPARNRVKTYVEDGYYHIYNRGVEKRDIFIDDQDYCVFLNFLKAYLSPPVKELSHPVKEVTGSGPVRLRLLKSFFMEITLRTYCLMPNHFHLIIHQINKNSMSKFMQALGTSYSMYFNKKYNRVGVLFQSVYRATLVMEDFYLLHLSRYIHLNPSELPTGSDPVMIQQYPYSSYAYYLGKKNATWINPEPILSFFKNTQKANLKDFLSYQSFIEDYLEDSKEFLSSLTID